MLGSRDSVLGAAVSRGAETGIGSDEELSSVAGGTTAAVMTYIHRMEQHQLSHNTVYQQLK